jgi:uncharacterized membrane protein
VKHREESIENGFHRPAGRGCRPRLAALLQGLSKPSDMPIQPLCITCSRQVREAIWNDSFAPNLFSMLSAFWVLALLVFLLHRLAARRYRRQAFKELPDPLPPTMAAIILGIGIGGFIDGIVLHQILQWHEMLSNRLPPTTLVAKSVNMFWDGVFHAFTLLVVVTGIVLLWRLGRRPNLNRSGYLLAGGGLIGWGLFNLVEGIIDHQLLKLHNVREITDSPEAWNIGFLLFSLLLLAGGWGLVRRGQLKDGYLQDRKEGSRLPGQP